MPQTTKQSIVSSFPYHINIHFDNLIRKCYIYKQFKSFYKQYLAERRPKMTQEDREFLGKITAYADEVMGDIDPEKVRISEQLDKLRPVLQELAMIHKMPVEDVFIKYMDLATEAAIEKNNKFNEDYKEILGTNPTPKFY